MIHSADLTRKTYYVSIYGQYNEVLNSTFSGKRNIGVLLRVRNNPVGDFHRIARNYFYDRPQVEAGNPNNYETVRIGDSTTFKVASYTLLEFNRFEACDGEVEAVSIKSAGNVIRYNTFVNNRGGLTLRRGRDNVVLNNIFDGGGKEGSCGIRVVDRGHLIAGNYFYNLAGDTTNRGTLVLLSGENDPAPGGYAAARDIVFVYNTLVNCRRLINLSDERRSVAPSSITIQHNLIVNHLDSEVIQVNGVEFRRGYNVVDSPLRDVDPALGAIIRDIALRFEDRLPRTVPAFRSDSKASGLPVTLLRFDVDGQKRNLHYVGADTPTQGAANSRYITRTEVGDRASRPFLDIERVSSGCLENEKCTSIGMKYYTAKADEITLIREDYLRMPPFTSFASGPDNPWQVRFAYRFRAGLDYRIRLLVLTRDSSSDSVYFRIGEEGDIPLHFGTKHIEWSEHTVQAPVSAGDFTISLREKNVRIMAMEIIEL